MAKKKIAWPNKPLPPSPFKPPKQSLTAEATTRAITMLHEILMFQKRSNGPYKTQVALLKSIGITAAKFGKLAAQMPEQYLSAESLAKLCNVHGVSAEYILTGQGARYYGQELLFRIKNLEQRMDDFEEKFVRKTSVTSSKGQ